MNVDTNWETGTVEDQKRGLRSVAGFLIIALAVGAALLVLVFLQGLRAHQDPTLDALLRARAHLSQSYGPEENLLSQMQTAHRELDAAIALLARVAQTDPDSRDQIASLRARLKGLEDKGVLDGMSSAELDARYQALRAEIKGLIDERLSRGR